jgi:hypothetical protein
MSHSQATEELFEGFQHFDKNFPFLVGGAPLWAFPKAKLGLDAMKALLADLDNHSESACTFILERERYVLETMSTCVPLCLHDGAWFHTGSVVVPHTYHLASCR